MTILRIAPQEPAGAVFHAPKRHKPMLMSAADSRSILILNARLMQYKLDEFSGNSKCLRARIMQVSAYKENCFVLKVIR